MFANLLIFGFAVALVLTYLSVIHVWLASDRNPPSGH
jgi:hypothetical protein